MLRGQGMLKGRCRFLFSDLKVFLLRPPAPPLTFIPMNGQNTDSHANGVAGTGSFADNNNTLVSAPELEGSTAPPTGGAAGPDEDTVAEGWPSTAAGRPGTLDCSSSSDDCFKEKSEERFSLTSCTDSGFRTPSCRICFQGPEQSVVPLVRRGPGLREVPRDRVRSSTFGLRCESSLRGGGGEGASPLALVIRSWETVARLNDAFQLSPSIGNIATAWQDTREACTLLPMPRLDLPPSEPRQRLHTVWTPCSPNRKTL
ncbi:hypothetical protein SKAU_G00238150 [Synaphobranchus kaupii]|uniref:Uncharacterized protein n=1 Tax=Synaphobranchus kaupii TaxID=118154 RepID=A0A9Q1F710_SYNKA|nr:hypothetical protein SKAU_G00238150 [Synaphobranchus kaupii]